MCSPERKREALPKQREKRQSIGRKDYGTRTGDGN